MSSYLILHVPNRITKMMLRLAPVSPNKVVVPPSSSSTRIPTFATPRHLLVTRNPPILAIPWKSEYVNITIICFLGAYIFAFIFQILLVLINLFKVKAAESPNRPDDFPFHIGVYDDNVMTRELNREEIHATITFIEKDRSESESIGGVFPPEGMLLAVKISKGNGMSATFDVKLWPHDMKVDFLTVKTLGMPEL